MAPNGRVHWNSVSPSAAFYLSFYFVGGEAKPFINCNSTIDVHRIDETQGNP